MLKGVNNDNIKYVKRCKSRKDKDYMYRKYIIDLEKWLVNPRRKPLIVWGARQVGKSYLVKDIFAETYFKNNYILNIYNCQKNLIHILAMYSCILFIFYQQFKFRFQII